jgi:hypothetical protein
MYYNREMIAWQPQDNSKATESGWNHPHQRATSAYTPLHLPAMRPHQVWSPACDSETQQSRLASSFRLSDASASAQPSPQSHPAWGYKVNSHDLILMIWAVKAGATDNSALSIGAQRTCTIFEPCRSGGKDSPQSTHGHWISHGCPSHACRWTPGHSLQSDTQKVWLDHGMPLYASLDLISAMEGKMEL